MLFNLISVLYVFFMADDPKPRLLTIASTSRYQPSLSASHCLSLDNIVIHRSHVSTYPLCTKVGMPQQKTKRDNQSYESAIPHPARTLSKDTDVTAQKHTRCTHRVNVTLCSAQLLALGAAAPVVTGLATITGKVKAVK